MQPKITPNLWFNGNAPEAVAYYRSVFPDSEVLATDYYPQTEQEGLADFQLEFAGKPLSIEFKILGQHYVAINAGSEFAFNESVSFSIACEDQKEIDYYWGKLSAVQEAEQCGWCKDKFGLSWQIVPATMAELMQRQDAFKKMMNMKKIIIADF